MQNVAGEKCRNAKMDLEKTSHLGSQLPKYKFHHGSHTYVCVCARERE
jgi:hypothetical protein